MHGDIAPLEHAVRSALRLPGMPVDGEAIALPLDDHIAAQALTSIVVMAVHAGQVELATSLEKEGLARFCGGNLPNFARFHPQGL